MEKKISVFISTHKEDVYVPENNLFQLIQVGSACKDHLFTGMLHDSEGINISYKNPFYCELTGQYWAWKNHEADYYGFFHYRRYFSFSEKKYPVEFRPFIFGEVIEDNNYSKEVLAKYSLDSEKMREIIEEYDFLAPDYTAAPGNATVYKQYEESFGHHIEDLDCVMDIIRRDYPEYTAAAEKYIFGTRYYSCNMFIMKRELFLKYNEWLFDILQKFEDSRNLEKYPEVDKRVAGYLAERLCGVFLCHLYEKGYRGKELQRVYFLNTNKDKSTDTAALNDPSFISSFKHRLKDKAYDLAVSAFYNAKQHYISTHTGKTAITVIKNEGNNPVDINITRVARITNGFFLVNVHAEYVSVSPGEDAGAFAYDIKGGDGMPAITGDVIIIKEEHLPYEESFEIIKHGLYFAFYLEAIPEALNISVETGNNKSIFSADSRYMLERVEEWNVQKMTASERPDYNEWFLAKRVSEKDLMLQRSRIFNIQPVFSVVVPLYKTNISFFKEMADSVLEQSYSRLELILVDASPELAELTETIDYYKSKDSRVKAVYLEENYGITENTNYGMDAAAGDFICFLDHDDVLEKNALYEYVKVLNEQPETDLFYCDEDKLSEGRYCDPYFKPDFNMDLLCGINYVCHFLTVRADIAKNIERPSKIYDGAQDHNMTFRVAEKARKTAHVAKVLYHWRIHKDSTALDPEEKPYSMEAARLSVEHHLERCNINAHAVNSPKVPRHYELVYYFDTHPKVSVIIPTKNNADMLKNCISSIINRTTYDNYEIVIVDNSSDDERVFAYYGQLESMYGFVRVVKYDGAFNFSAVVNYGVSKSSGEYVTLLNNDTEVITDSWIEKMLGPCMRDDVGAVGAKLLFKDNTIQHAGVVINEIGPCHLNYGLDRFAPGYYNTAILPMDVSAVTGACIMSRKAVYEAAGGFDETLATNYNDVDYCLKLRKAGYNIFLNSLVELYHFETMTRKKEENSIEGRTDMKKALAVLISRYPEIFAAGDPYYNKNFAPNSIYFSL